MNCPNCGTANPEEAKFCMNCGHALALDCPNCGVHLPGVAKFCFNCGEAVRADRAVEAAGAQATATRARMQQSMPGELARKLRTARDEGLYKGERKLVTALFADMVGSTELATDLDPEEYREIVGAVHRFVSAAIYKYEGTIAQLLGDGVLAFFGAPLAHEDDPQRAVLASLEIQEAARSYARTLQREGRAERFQMRIGINTGMVVVGNIGTDLHMEYLAVGDAVNLAARMEQTAAPETIQISGYTHKLVEPLFDFEALGEVKIKGKSEPESAFRVLGAKALPGRLRGIKGLDSPLVGREEEYQRLRRSLLDLQAGQGQIVSVVGEAGIGKSRLVAELRRGFGTEPGADGKLIWMEGRSVSYETATPYATFIDLLENVFQLNEGLPEVEKFERIESRVVERLPDRSMQVAPFLAALLGVQLEGEALQRVKYLEPPDLRRSVFQAACEYFEAVAAGAPTVLMFDDLHWADAISLELLEHLMPITERAPLMLLALFRPERHDLTWRFHETAEREFSQGYISVELNPLDEGTARQLVANLLHVEDLPMEVRELILSKSEGNPFFVEEVIRSLLDAELVVPVNGHWRATQEIRDVAIPDTVTAVIATRLDRLEENARRALQTAAVIGRQFPLTSLEALYAPPGGLGELLDELQRRELVRERSREPQLVYAFKHVLTQEAAYNSLLVKQRQGLHLQLGEYLESHSADRVNDIARNFLEANKPERALPFLLEAGDRAARAYSTADAIRDYEQALELLGTDGDVALTQRAFEGLGSALTFANEIPRALETYERMQAQAEAGGNMPMRISALNKLSYVTALRLGQFEQAERYLEESDRTAREHDDKAGLSELGLIRCMMCTAVADFEGVVRYMDETVDLGRELGVKDQMSLGLAHIASSQIFMLQFEEGYGTIQKGLQLSREIGDREHESQQLGESLALYHFCRGELEQAHAAAKQGLEIAEQIGSTQNAMLALRSLGSVSLARGEYDPALGFFDRYLRASQKLRTPWSIADALGLIGATYLELAPGSKARTEEIFAQALETLEAPAGGMMGATVWTEVAIGRLETGDADGALELLERALTIPTISQNFERPRILVSSGLANLMLGNLDQAVGLVDQAEAYAEEHHLRLYEPLVAYARGKVLVGDARLEEAIIAFQHAEESAREIDRRPLLWKALQEEARALAAAGRANAAESKRREASEIVGALAGLIEDEEVRTEFLAGALRG